MDEEDGLMRTRFNFRFTVLKFVIPVFIMLLLAGCQPASTADQPTRVPQLTDTAAPTTPPTAAPISTAQPSATILPSATPTALVPLTGGTATGKAATIMTRQDPLLGPILVDSQGMTLYMFANDARDQSNCIGGCLQAWPPFLTNDAPTAGEGLDPALIGNTVMADGSIIVTYNHMPLYYWAGDLKPGDTNGQNVNNVWFVVAPDGNPVGKPPASTNPYGSDY